MTDEHDSDERLRERLRSVDPAASLPTADPTRVARLLEDTMTDDHIDESRRDGTHGRSRLTWAVAAVAVLVIGGGALVATTLGDDRADPPVAEGTSAPGTGVPDTTAADPTTAGTVTELTVGEPTSARCIPPDPGNRAAIDVVAAQDVAFDGTVTSISGGSVTLTPTEFFAGEPTDEVVVAAPGEDVQALLSAVDFAEGGRYLVSATGGQVTVCGFSAAYSDDLAAVYAEAFGGRR